MIRTVWLSAAQNTDSVQAEARKVTRNPAKHSERAQQPMGGPEPTQGATSDSLNFPIHLHKPTIERSELAGQHVADRCSEDRSVFDVLAQHFEIRRLANRAPYVCVGVCAQLADK